ncbi:MAG: heme-copper oxidase subunit III [Myxococcota bacterium]|jgi:cytochrome c oxidase subunit 3|nr:heme-copper oxidase subunit III [Myxococcota bacterium]
MDPLTQAEVIAKKKANTSKIGMLVFLGSWAMMFAACFYSYTLLRVLDGGWPLDGMPALPVVLPGVNTLILLASSVCIHLAVRSIRRGKQTAFLGWLVATPLLGFVFTGLQILLWTDLIGEGLTHQTGAYGSAFYFLTVFHALHVVVGLGMLVSVVPKARRGGYTPDDHHGVVLVSMFWHFVDVVWVLMYLMIFIA